MRKAPRIRASWRKPLTLIAIALLSSSCVGKPPKIDIALWAGDSAKQGITRAPETIPAKDPRIDGYVALTYADLKKLFDAIQSCKQWPAEMPLMTAEEAANALTVYQSVSSKAR